MDEHTFSIGRQLVLRLLLLHLVLLLSLPCSSHSQGQSAEQASPQLLTASPAENVIIEPVDWIFVIDTSASMSGRNNIFPRVQQTLREFVSAIRDEDTLSVFVFDSTSRLESSTLIKSPTDRDDVIANIDQLTAKGEWTHTGAALSDALKHVTSRSDPKRKAAIILLTDGKEDVRGIKDPIRISDAIKLIPDKNVPYVFYVSLGTARDPQLSNFIGAINDKTPGRGRILDDPRAEELPQLANEVRTTVRPPALTLQPQSLDLGNLEPGSDGGPYSIDVSSDIQTTLTLAPADLPSEYHLEGLPDTLDAGPRQRQRVTFRLKVGETATEGAENFKVVISPPAGLGLTTQVIPIKLVVREGVLTRIIKLIRKYWQTGLLIALLILAVALLAYLVWKYVTEGKTMLDIIRDFLRPEGSGRTAVLSTPDGTIRLDKPNLALGRGGSMLSNSSATIEINREGAYHIVAVREGSVTITDRLHEYEHSLEAGSKRRLEDRDQLVIPGYQKPLMYLHTARKH